LVPVVKRDVRAVLEVARLLLAQPRAEVHRSVLCDADQHTRAARGHDQLAVADGADRDLIAGSQADGPHRLHGQGDLVLGADAGPFLCCTHPK